jgi:hypothetical protein
MQSVFDKLIGNTVTFIYLHVLIIEKVEWKALMVSFYFNLLPGLWVIC